MVLYAPFFCHKVGTSISNANYAKITILTSLLTTGLVMSHIDTLKVYEELVESGVPEQQAKAHVHLLNASFDSVATKDDLLRMEVATKQDFIRLEKDIDSKFKYVYVLGAAIFAVSSIPIIQKVLLNL